MASPSTLGTRRGMMFDKALELRAITASAISATTSTTPLNLAMTKAGFFELVLDVAAHTGYVATTAQWDFTVEVSDVSGSGYVTVASHTANGTATQLRIPLSGQYVNAKKADADYIRVTATKTGSPGSVQFGAWINGFEA